MSEEKYKKEFQKGFRAFLITVVSSLLLVSGILMRLGIPVVILFGVIALISSVYGIRHLWRISFPLGIDTFKHHKPGKVTKCKKCRANICGDEIKCPYCGYDNV